MVNKEIKEKIESASSITILTHINPDADTIGTALGIYTLLKENKVKCVEVVNASNALPVYLDFLPYYKKIKHQIDYSDSLIITCDCASLDRVGFDVEGREILNIDHHESNTLYGSMNVVVGSDASASQGAYRVFNDMYEITKEVAECFYTALISDTRFFSTRTVDVEVMKLAEILVSKGVKPDKVAMNLTRRASLASLRILEKALASLRLYEEARVAVLFITKEDRIASGAMMSDMEGIVDYGNSLGIVEIAICAIESEDGIRISLRSKQVDVLLLASAFGGGGHKFASGFTLENTLLQKCIPEVLVTIKKLGMLDGI